MKKVYTVIAAIVLSGAVMAQNETKFGIKFGRNVISYLKEDQLTDHGKTYNVDSFFGTAPAAHAGLFVNIPLSKAVALHTEIDYSALWFDGQGVLGQHTNSR